MRKKIILYALVLTLSISCKKKDDGPNFPLEPYIEFRDITFIHGQPSVTDTLKVSFYFRDGDFDLGLNESELNDPYNRKFYFLRSNGAPVPDTKFQHEEVDLADLISYRFKRTHLPDTLPVFITPYNCRNWEINRDPSTGKIADTLYFRQNKNFYNLYVTILIVNTNGSTSVFDFSQNFIFPNCQLNAFNRRFRYPKESPVPGSPFSVNMISSKEGTFTYDMRSAGWKNLFAGQKIKLRISIRDRALHLSNEIETTEVQF